MNRKVHRDAHGGVAKPFTDDLWIDAGGQPERCDGMPQVVDSQRSDAYLLGNSVEGLPDGAVI